jgi:hypothetical protein
VFRGLDCSTSSGAVEFRSPRQRVVVQLFDEGGSQGVTGQRVGLGAREWPRRRVAVGLCVAVTAGNDQETPPGAISMPMLSLRPGRSAGARPLDEPRVWCRGCPAAEIHFSNHQNLKPQNCVVGVIA